MFFDKICMMLIFITIILLHVFGFIATMTLISHDDNNFFSTWPNLLQMSYGGYLSLLFIVEFLESRSLEYSPIFFFYPFSLFFDYNLSFDGNAFSIEFVSSRIFLHAF